MSDPSSPLSGTGTASPAKAPESQAAAARRWLSSEYSSMSSRLTSHRSASTWATRNWAHRPALDLTRGTTGGRVRCRPGRWRPAAPGSWSRPRRPPPGRSGRPSTPAAAKCMACWEEPHWRSTVVAGTLWGSPAATQALRVTLVLCSPTWVTHPPITSSMRPRVDPGPVQQRGEGEAQQVGRMPVGQRPTPLAHGGADHVDDDGVALVGAHGGLHPPSRWISLLRLRGPVPAAAAPTAPLGVAPVLVTVGGSPTAGRPARRSPRADITSSTAAMAPSAGTAVGHRAVLEDHRGAGQFEHPVDLLFDHQQGRARPC